MLKKKKKRRSVKRAENPFKPKTYRNDNNIKAVSEQYCTACGSWPVDVHHIKSVGSGGSDHINNLMPLCRTHHIEIHKIGRLTFMEKYEIIL